MELIEINSYTPMEKFKIASEYLIPQELKKHGLKKNEINLSQETIKLIIEKFTREAGVRNLRRVFSRIFRKIVKKIVIDNEKKLSITVNNIEEYLDNPVFEIDIAENKNSVGIGNGLAWTSVGGDVLKIEAVKFKGKGILQLTGNMGDVMKESARIAYSVVKSLINKNIKYKAIKVAEFDIHMHIPEGATPKDGPSAGIGMCIAMVSVLTNIPVRADVAMTGEITLRGEILPIGGLKEKLLAALRGGIRLVLIPDESQRDLQEIPDNIKDNLKIRPVKWIEEVLGLALQRIPTPREKEEPIVNKPMVDGTISLEKKTSVQTH
jgi:ATP-dependent Lon protease